MLLHFWQRETSNQLSRLKKPAKTRSTKAILTNCWEELGGIGLLSVKTNAEPFATAHSSGCGSVYLLPTRPSGQQVNTICRPSSPVPQLIHLSPSDEAARETGGWMWARGQCLASVIAEGIRGQSCTVRLKSAAHLLPKWFWIQPFVKRNRKKVSGKPGGSLAIW